MFTTLLISENEAHTEEAFVPLSVASRWYRVLRFCDERWWGAVRGEESWDEMERCKEGSGGEMGRDWYNKRKVVPAPQYFSPPSTLTSLEDSLSMR